MPVIGPRSHLSAIAVGMACELDPARCTSDSPGTTDRAGEADRVPHFRIIRLRAWQTDWTPLSADRTGRIDLASSGVGS